MLYIYDTVTGGLAAAQPVPLQQQNSMLISSPPPYEHYEFYDDSNSNQRKRLLQTSGSGRSLTLVASPPDKIFWAAGQAMHFATAVGGEPVWTYETNGYIFMSPALDAATNTLVFGSDDGNVTAVNAATGSLNWTVALNTTIGPDFGSADCPAWTFRNAQCPQWYNIEWTPTIVAGAGPPTFVIVGATDASIRALDLATGAQRWVFFGGNSSVNSQPTGDFGFEWGSGIFWHTAALYFAGCIDGNVYALDIITGALVWSANTGGPISS
jgi:outer membrane protein assembly factor BamB